jgi:hypothetical protein
LINQILTRLEPEIKGSHCPARCARRVPRASAALDGALRRQLLAPMREPGAVSDHACVQRLHTASATTAERAAARAGACLALEPLASVDEVNACAGRDAHRSQNHK